MIKYFYQYIYDLYLKKEKTINKTKGLEKNDN